MERRKEKKEKNHWKKNIHWGVGWKRVGVSKLDAFSESLTLQNYDN